MACMNKGNDCSKNILIQCSHGHLNVVSNKLDKGEPVLSDN